MNKVISFSENNDLIHVPSFVCTGLLDVVNTHSELKLFENNIGIILDFGLLFKNKLLEEAKLLNILNNIFFMDAIAIYKSSHPCSKKRRIAIPIINNTSSSVFSKDNFYSHLFIDNEENLLGVAKFYFFNLRIVFLTSLSSVKGVPEIKLNYTGISIGTPLMKSVIQNLQQTQCEILEIETYFLESCLFYKNFFESAGILSETQDFGNGIKIKGYLK